MDAGIGQFIPLILIFVIFYFFLIRPQQKKVKEHKNMVENLKRGDKVVTSGGIIGSIERIIIDSTGYGYMNRYGKVKTVYGDIVSDTTSELSNEDSKSVTGQLDDVIVANTGFDYNSTDTIEIGDGKNEACGKLKVLGGRIVGVEIECTGHGFTSIPDIKINSETGIGADLRATLKFTDVSEVSETLDPAGVISVVNCVGKPLTRTRLGK